MRLPVLFSPSQLYGWCGGQPTSTEDQKVVFVSFLLVWGSLRFTPKCCRSLEGHCQGHSKGHFSGHCLAWSSGLRQLGEPQHMGCFWWRPAIMCFSFRESGRACCRWAADGRRGNKSVLFWTTGYVLSLHQTENTWGYTPHVTASAGDGYIKSLNQQCL